MVLLLIDIIYWQKMNLFITGAATNHNGSGWDPSQCVSTAAELGDNQRGGNGTAGADKMPTRQA